MMYKFFKELFSTTKDDVSDSKGEVDVREELRRNDSEQIQLGAKKLLLSIPYEEQFGNALGAAMRVIVFGDWFTVFGSTEDDGRHPIHLYQFGDYPKIDQYRDDFAKILKKDFAIEDRDTCLAVLAGYFTVLGLTGSTKSLEGKVGKINLLIWDISKPGVNAFAVAIASYVTTAATDVRFLSKIEALEILKQLSLYAKKHFSNWTLFSDRLLEGENHVGLNSKIGKSYLKRYSGYLKEKKGSPWNNIDWLK